MTRTYGRRPISARRYQQRTNAGLSPAQFQTYQVLAPIRTHWRFAKCAEVDCPGARRVRCEEVDCGHHQNGWRTILPVGSPMLKDARTSGRAFVELLPKDGLIESRFAAGQQCFARHERPGGPCPMQDRHLVPLERPGLYVVRDGDRRDRTGARRTFANSEDWAGHFAEHQDKLKAQRGW